MIAGETIAGGTTARAIAEGTIGGTTGERGSATGRVTTGGDVACGLLTRRSSPESRVAWRPRHAGGATCAVRVGSVGTCYDTRDVCEDDTLNFE